MISQQGIRVLARITPRVAPVPLNMTDKAAATYLILSVLIACNLSLINASTRQNLHVNGLDFVGAHRGQPVCGSLRAWLHLLQRSPPAVVSLWPRRLAEEIVRTKIAHKGPAQLGTIKRDFLTRGPSAVAGCRGRVEKLSRRDAQGIDRDVVTDSCRAVPPRMRPTSRACGIEGTR